MILLSQNRLSHLVSVALSDLSNMAAFGPMLYEACVPCCMIIPHQYDGLQPSLDRTHAFLCILMTSPSLRPLAQFCLSHMLSGVLSDLSNMAASDSALYIPCDLYYIKWTSSTWRLLASVFCPMPRLLHYATSPTWRHLSQYAFCCIIRPLQQGEIWSSIVWSMCSQLHYQIFPTLLPSLAQCRLHTFCYLWHAAAAAAFTLCYEVLLVYVHISVLGCTGFTQRTRDVDLVLMLCSMLGRRRRRWFNIISALGKCLLWSLTLGISVFYRRMRWIAMPFNCDFGSFLWHFWLRIQWIKQKQLVTERSGKKTSISITLHASCNYRSDTVL